LIKSH